MVMAADLGLSERPPTVKGSLQVSKSGFDTWFYSIFLFDQKSEQEKCPKKKHDSARRKKTIFFKYLFETLKVFIRFEAHDIRFCITQYYVEMYIHSQ